MPAYDPTAALPATVGAAARGLGDTDELPEQFGAPLFDGVDDVQFGKFTRHGVLSSLLPGQAPATGTRPSASGSKMRAFAAFIS